MTGKNTELEAILKRWVHAHLASIRRRLLWDRGQNGHPHHNGRGFGRIWVSDVTRMMVGPDKSFAFSPAKTLNLKGLEDAQTLHPLEWQT